MFRQKSVLIVDDEEMVRRPLRKRLTKLGYACDEAGSTDEALQKLQNNTADLVLLDLKMPGRSGIELLQEIRARYNETPVIVATAVNETGVAVQCKDLGAQDYIMKPFNLDEVVLSIYRVLCKGCEHQANTLSYLPWLKRTDKPASPLTSREAQVISLIARGHLNKQIANILGISEQTVKNHITSILRKLEVTCRTEAAVVALRRGLIAGEKIRIEDMKTAE